MGASIGASGWGVKCVAGKCGWEAIAVLGSFPQFYADVPAILTQVSGVGG